MLHCTIVFILLQDCVEIIGSLRQLNIQVNIYGNCVMQTNSCLLL